MEKEKTQNSRSLWRTKGEFYFNVPKKISKDAEIDNAKEDQIEKAQINELDDDDIGENANLRRHSSFRMPVEKLPFYRYAHIKEIKETVKIGVDMNYPYSFFVNNNGKCSLYSISSSCRPTFLGSASLPTSTSPSSPSITQPTSVAHYNDWIMVSTHDGVFQYQVNSIEVVRGQNIDDFVQMALPIQQQPTNLKPVVSFISSDVQIPDWPFPNASVIEASKLKEEDKQSIKRRVEESLAASKVAFKANLIAFYDHDVSSRVPLMPMSGPADDGVRKIAFTHRKPTIFQTICNNQWFEWDIQRQKLTNFGDGDGFQILTIDTSPILRTSFAVGTHGGNVMLHDTRTKTCVQMKFTEPHPISHVKFSPFIQPLLATSTDDFLVKLWDIRSGFDQPYLVLDGHTHEISGIQFSAHRADLLYTSSYDSTIRLWNINDQLPPHHSMISISPSPGSPIAEIVPGCHRTDSVYYSCFDGTTGMAKMNEVLFDDVIPHKLKDSDDRIAETLLYQRKNQKLLNKILPKVSKILTERSNVEPIFPLLDLTITRPYDLAQNKFDNNTPMKELIDFYSYFLTQAIPTQLMQQPEPNQLADATRFLLFGKVIGSIQKNDADTLIYEKRNILSTLEAFSREDILSISMVLASSTFDEALEVGNSYLDLLIRNKKLDKFLDIGYFLMFPTIYDDPVKSFQVLNQVEHNVRTALRTMLNNGPKVLAEIRDYIGILATASNDKENSMSRIYETLKKHDRFLSMFLCRTFLSAALSLQQWSSCIITAAQAAKDTVGFPFHDIMFNWLDNEVRERFYLAIVETLNSKNTAPASYINAISEVILVASQAQELPKQFEDMLDSLINLVHDILNNLLKGGSAVKISTANVTSLAIAIKRSVETPGRSVIQQGLRTRSVNTLMTLITNVISTAPPQ